MKRCRLCKSERLHPPWDEASVNPWHCLDCGAWSYFPLSLVPEPEGSDAVTSEP